APLGSRLAPPPGAAPDGRHPADRRAPFRRRVTPLFAGRVARKSVPRARVKCTKIHQIQDCATPANNKKGGPRSISKELTLWNYHRGGNRTDSQRRGCRCSKA